MKRNLDGVYFRVGKENVCFSDLTSEQQEEVIKNWDNKALIRLCKALAAAIKTIGDQFGIVGGYQDED